MFCIRCGVARDSYFPVFDNKSSQPAAVVEKKQQEVKGGSRSYEARAKRFDTKVPGATPFQDNPKEYEVKAPTVGMFGEISKDGESILEIAAWKRADEYCTFFASKPQVALSRIKQQMHREVGHNSMLQIVRNIRDNMEFLELPGGGTHLSLPCLVNLITWIYNFNQEIKSDQHWAS